MGDFFMETVDLLQRLGAPDAPLIFDVRRREAFEADPELLPTALWRDHRKVADWAAGIPAGGSAVVYCVHGEQVGQSAEAFLRSRGVAAQALRGGIEAWRAAGGMTIPSSRQPVRDGEGASRWVLPLDPSLAMLGRAWFLRRFLDPGARFFFVGVDQVGAAAVELEAVALSDPEGLILPSALADLEERLAGGNLPLRNFMRIVAAAGAAVGEGEAAPPEAAGLEALVEGLRCLPVGAGARLERGIELCDALYAWLRRRDRDGGEAGDRP